MTGFLFDNLIYGPVHSRRLGVSLGVNLLPTDNKFCNFNCIYCECGWAKKYAGHKIIFPGRKDFSAKLEAKLKELQNTENEPNSITFAGNGEPTIHPEFAEIIDDTIAARNKYVPNAVISILTNASLLHKQSVAEALKKVDQPILKLDSAVPDTFNAINQPVDGITLDKIINSILSFDGKVFIQTLFLRGSYNGNFIDNTTDYEVKSWINILKKINPEFVMIYPVDRETPVKDLEKISESELSIIANTAENEGITVKAFF